MAELAARSDEEVAEASRAALRAGRPMLAARAVGMMDQVAWGDPELDRARRAARFILAQPTPDQAPTAELDEALGSLQASWVARFKRRLRQVNRTPDEPPQRRPRRR